MVYPWDQALLRLRQEDHNLTMITSQKTKDKERWPIEGSEVQPAEHTFQVQ